MHKKEPSIMDDIVNISALVLLFLIYCKSEKASLVRVIIYFYLGVLFLSAATHSLRINDSLYYSLNLIIDLTIILLCYNLLIRRTDYYKTTFFYLAWIIGFYVTPEIIQSNGGPVADWYAALMLLAPWIDIIFALAGSDNGLKRALCLKRFLRRVFYS